MRTTCSFLLAATLAACAADGDGDVPVAPSSAALYQIGSLWPGGNVPVCYDPNDGNNASLLYDARRILETNGWPVVANVRFTGWQACPTGWPQGATVRVHFAPGSPGNTSPTPGWQGPLNPSEVTLISNGTTAHFTYEVLHEFGHALGFAHEQERPDNWPNGAGGATVYCNQHDIGETVTYGGAYRTPYFDTESVMSYCNPAFATELSPGDVFGAQMAYGKRSAVAAGQNPSSNAVARTPDALFTFFAHSDGSLWSTAWWPGIDPGHWPTSAVMPAGTLPPGARVAALSRTIDYVDALFVDSTGHVMDYGQSSHLDSPITITDVSGSWPHATPGEQVAAVSSAPGMMDVVYAATDGNLHWNRFSAQHGPGWFAERFVTRDGQVPVGAAVSAVARRADQIDAFYIGKDGKLHTTWCAGFGRTGAGSCNQDSWGAYVTSTTSDCLAPPGAPLTAVARTSDNLDVFWVSSGGALCTAYWNPNVAFTSYRITAPGVVPVGSSVAAVARTPDQLDITVAARNPSGVVDFFVARWHTGASAWAWVDAQPIFGGRAVPGQVVAITARRPDVIDLFTPGINIFTTATTSQSTAYWSEATSWGGYATNTY